MDDFRVAYRLVGNPVLRDEHRSAKILGALARMEHGPVTSGWFSRRTGLKPKAAHALLEDICAQGCAQRIVLPASAPDSELGEISQTPESGAMGLDDHAQQAPRNRLRSAYDFIRRTVA
jgi:hypothetical protein